MESDLSHLGLDGPERGHRTLAEKAYARLHAAIITGRLAPGMRLPIEELAEHLGMSPMPVREALRRLDAIGLVTNRPHRGASVSTLSVDDLAEAVEARLALELPTMRKAAERFTSADERRARRRLEALHSLRDEGSPQVAAAHEAFHFSLYEASRSAWLVRLLRPAWQTVERYCRLHPAAVRLHERRSEHVTMLEACVAHRLDRAAACTHFHLITTANYLAVAMGGAPLFAGPSIESGPTPARLGESATA